MKNKKIYFVWDTFAGSIKEVVIIIMVFMMNSTKIVDLTDKAIQRVKEIFQNENKGSDIGLRLGVIGGGCSGLSYKIDFDTANDKDKIFDFDGVKVFIDLKSSIYLKGVTIDFKDGLNGKGFVFINPNAANTCGCGESFSV